MYIIVIKIVIRQLYKSFSEWGLRIDLYFIILQWYNIQIVVYFHFYTSIIFIRNLYYLVIGIFL